MYINKSGIFESRSVQLGHVQRGGSPCAFDMVLSTAYGAYAAKLVRESKYGYMPVFVNNAMTDAPIKDAINALKVVPQNHEMITMAKSIGVSFGQDE